MNRPSIETQRLNLRPFVAEDAPDVQRLAGDFAIADTTMNISHPYEDGAAEKWIASQESDYEKETGIVFAIVLPDRKELVGAIGLTFDHEHKKAELGYWIGKPFWNQGYATEATNAVLGYGFVTLGLNRISARHLARNPASGKVMKKVGMVFEGTARQDIVKWEKFEDSNWYGIIRDEWSAGQIT